MISHFVKVSAFVYVVSLFLQSMSVVALAQHEISSQKDQSFISMNHFEPIEVYVAESHLGVRLKAIAEIDRQNTIRKRCIFFMSTDSGKTWDQIEESNVTWSCVNPVVASDKKGNLYRIAMFFGPDRKSKLKISKLEASKTKFGPWITILENETHSADKPWMIAEGDGHLFVTFTEEKDMSIRFASSIDGGQTWNSAIKLSKNGSELTQGSFVGRAHNGDLLVSFAAYRNGPVFLSRSKDNGRNFTTKKVATETGFKLGVPPVTQIIDDPKDPKRKLILWYEGHGYNSINVIESKDDGVSWSKPNTLVSGSGALPSGAIDHHGHLHLIWTEIDRTHKTAETLHQTFDQNLAPTTKPKSISEKYQVKREIFPHIGAYQNLLRFSDGSITATWINWANPNLAEVREQKIVSPID